MITACQYEVSYRLSTQEQNMAYDNYNDILRGYLTNEAYCRVKAVRLFRLALL